jgi:hypothetical protein
MLYSLANPESIAAEWIAAWNAHDIDRILSHYHPQVRFRSPLIQQLGIDPTGWISDKATLQRYFERGLSAYPDLHFTLRQVLVGCESVLIYYDSIQGLQAAEQLVLDEAGLIRQVDVHYSSAASEDVS